MSSPNFANAALAARLVHVRGVAGFATSDAAAIQLGMSAQTYRFHEQGQHAARPSELRRYAEAFGVSHGWLSTGIGAGPKTAG